MDIPRKMKAARMHDVGAPMVIEEIDTPRPRANEVLVRVRACGMVPNLVNVISRGGPWYPPFPHTRLPAIFGLDPAGEIVAVGEHVLGFQPGERVYVNAGRSCETCEDCAAGNRILCKYYTFSGYFGHSAHSDKMFERHPSAGFAEYMAAPTTALARLEDSTTFEQAARLGYIGTAYSGLKKARVGCTSTVLINGSSGTLGLGGVISALAMGAPKVFATARDKELLERVRAIAPHRIEVFSTNDGSITDWVMSRTAGNGVHVVLDCLGPGTPSAPTMQALNSLRRGGTMVAVGGMREELPLKPSFFMSANRSFVGSLWFTTEEAREMALLAGAGLLDLTIFEHERYPLHEINTAIASMGERTGGFSNFLIQP